MTTLCCCVLYLSCSCMIYRFVYHPLESLCSRSQALCDTFGVRMSDTNISCSIYQAIPSFHVSTMTLHHVHGPASCNATIQYASLIISAAAFSVCCALILDYLLAHLVSPSPLHASTSLHCNLSLGLFVSCSVLASHPSSLSPPLSLISIRLPCTSLSSF